MDEQHREDVAMFRFGVISDLVCSHLDPGEMTELINRKSGQRWQIPHSGRTRISASTIRRWVRLYEQSGRWLSSLYSANRCDRGKSRRVDEETILALVWLPKEMPGLPVNRLLVECKASQAPYLRSLRFAPLVMLSLPHHTTCGLLRRHKPGAPETTYILFPAISVWCAPCDQRYL